MGEVATILGSIILVLVSLVALGVRSFIKGDIVPRGTLLDKTNDFNAERQRERQISEEWRTVALQVVPQLATLSQQNERLLRSLETVEAVIRAIPRAPIAVEGSSPGGHS